MSQETKIIQSITEAFSMQPNTLYVGQKVDAKLVVDKKQFGLFTVDSIKPEQVRIDGDIVDMYIGYDAEGRELFSYRAATVNVHYRYLVTNEEI